MNRERAKELLPIIEAFANGEDIQDCFTSPVSVWQDCPDPPFSDHCKYRIKPKAREFWIDPADHEVWLDQPNPPVPHAFKVREVIE